MYKKLLVIPLLGSILIGCNQAEQGNQESKEMKTALEYPKTDERNDADTLFGKVIPDPYRWLEDDMSDETAEWVKAQNEVTFDYLDKIPYRDELKSRLSELWNYERISAPSKKGDYVYYSKNDGLQNQSVIYRKDQDGNEEVFLDPNTFSEDGTTSLGQLSFTEDGTLAAYAISEGGSDWRKVIVMDAVNKEIIEDTLIDIKFSGLSWKNNEGFFYSSYDKPEGSELSAKTDQHKLYYHKLGTAQADDPVIYGATEEQKRRYVGGSVSKDGKYLFISGSVSTSGNELSVLDLTKENAEIKPLITGYDQDAGVVTTKGETFYISTNLDAPNKRLVKTTFNNPTAENWEDVIPETENVLSISKGAGYFFAQYMVDATTEVKQYDFDGKLIRSIELPGIGSAGGFGGKEDDEVLYYSFMNYVTPNSVFEFNPENGESKKYWEPSIDFNSDDFVSKQVFYESKDGTKVPMIITHKKGVEMNGNNPTILYGYGGFNVSLTPSFSTANAVWMENGGIYAVPNLRGGGEYGKEWHNAGTKMQKQNVFDDFISAAHYLIENNYTSSDYLAIRGGSNGGLLVGACMTQEPDLFKVALPAVGVLDMIRYHTFTAGAGWAYDYGTAEDSLEMLNYLLGYSPVHNVKEGVTYPATMITTGDHDDRVVPAHSFKFAAELQKKNAGNNPMLIRIEVNAGHGAGTPISKTIQQYADIYGFTLYNMGVTELGNTK
ncbi:prolyl oligopeptidase family serine peptidase [Brumimicrobium aurantiacum]|uniref:prolyl oligopeptidase n=1 Tax=Brumimicrobium aurantiacum TaxID=1737063 RepID=A0A3E1EV08_9FLAO|nr:prolyl oligopeptidase family serine peptidase [Brumimicrobium aurantiacum]RFC53313.1 S9 family peptidase [Brumimicrobium aurantiacum]